ncbi:MAG: DUF4332 domain-containing protein [Chloroflexia bacterium]|nr:DUF4332 domain-containing protein [Chloroflexia bacterium]
MSAIANRGLLLVLAFPVLVNQQQGWPWWVWLLLIIAVILILLLLWWWIGRSRKQDDLSVPTASSVAPSPLPTPTTTPEPFAGRLTESAASPPPPPEPTPAASALEPVKPIAVTPAKPEDLTRIEGIGPKISGLLRDAGIVTFAQLAGTAPERLKQILGEALLRLADPQSWPDQARLAAEGKWDELQALQEELKGGRRVE